MTWCSATSRNTFTFEQQYTRHGQNPVLFDFDRFRQEVWFRVRKLHPTSLRLQMTRCSTVSCNTFIWAAVPDTQKIPFLLNFNWFRQEVVTHPECWSLREALTPTLPFCTRSRKAIANYMNSSWNSKQQNLRKPNFIHISPSEGQFIKLKLKKKVTEFF